MREQLTGLAAALLLLAAPICKAAETVEVQVEQEGGAFHIYFEVLIDAPRDRVFRVLSDYEHLNELSPGVISSELISGPSDDGSAEIDVVLRPCVWIICRKMRKVSTVYINAYGAMVFTVVPEPSDFKRGREQVLVTTAKAPGRTRVTYTATLVPDFFVPPLVGSWLIRKHIIQNLEVSNPRIERLAQR